jgi:5-methylcytosine-specific restriction endonuclease McrA
MQCPKCRYHNKGNGKCEVCDHQMTPEVEKKVYRIPKKSEKQKTVKVKDIEYYKQCFYYSDRKCEECGIDLGENWDPYYVAHIISKGNNTALRWDQMNHVILCRDHHNQFDSEDRSKMKIYPRTEKIRQSLNKEYYQQPNHKLI